jgi:hypothetical protein
MNLPVAVEVRRVTRRYLAKSNTKIDNTRVEYTNGPRITAADIERIVGRQRPVVPGSCKLRDTSTGERTNEVRFSVITQDWVWLIGVARINLASDSQTARPWVEVEVLREEVPVPYQEGDDEAS